MDARAAFARSRVARRLTTCTPTGGSAPRASLAHARRVHSAPGRSRTVNAACPSAGCGVPTVAFSLSFTQVSVCPRLAAMSSASAIAAWRVGCSPRHSSPSSSSNFITSVCRFRVPARPAARARAEFALERPSLEGVHLGEGDPVAQRRELGVGARGTDRVDELEVRERAYGNDRVGRASRRRGTLGGCAPLGVGDRAAPAAPALTCVHGPRIRCRARGLARLSGRHGAFR